MKKSDQTYSYCLNLFWKCFQSHICLFWGVYQVDCPLVQTRKDLALMTGV